MLRRFLLGRQGSGTLVDGRGVTSGIILKWRSGHENHLKTFARCTVSLVQVSLRAVRPRTTWCWERQEWTGLRELADALQAAPRLVVASGGHSSSRCAGLSLSRPLVAEHRLQTRRLSSCGSRAQLLRGMWDPPRPGLEPVFPALAGRFSTTAPPGKPQI